MKILLDTHIIIWTLENNPKLSDKARELIEDESNEIFYSVASIWEVQIKHMARPDKMHIDGKDLSEKCIASGFTVLPVVERHVFALDYLKRKEGAAPHNDPFDRMLISQAKQDGLLFLTHDSLLPDYQEECIYAV